MKPYIKIVETSKKTSQILADCKKLFPVYSYYTDEQLDKDFPIPKKTTHYFRNVQEADEELKNMSAQDLEAKGIPGITLRERFLMELQYFRETGKHMDIDNYTLCSGSRDSDGVVPGVGFSGGEVDLYWFSTDHSNSNIRSRQKFKTPALKLVPLAVGLDLEKRAVYERLDKIEKLLDEIRTIV